MEGAQTSASLDHYAGSRLLQPLSDLSGLQIDQVNFVSVQLLSLGLAYPFRVQFHPSRCGPIPRHFIEFILGFVLTYFCYGYQTWCIVLQSVVCLALMKYLPIDIMAKVVFVVGLGFLLVAHLYRQLSDYGGYALDISGPLMVNTQRLTSMGFSLADGKETNPVKLRPDVRRQMIRQLPSLLEFFSYVFSFHMAMCGPFCFYNDYLAFIEGKSPQPHLKLNSLVQQRLMEATLCGLMLYLIAPLVPVTLLTDPEFMSHGPVYKMIFCVMCTTFIRSRYYFAWKLAEAASINAGLAFSGYDEKGEAKWDLIDNTNLVKVEFSTSLKSLIDNWNITTTKWLRHTVYYRVSWNPTTSVFLISAFWHGFYPGYYFCFITGVVMTETARKVRRNIRPYFVADPTLQFVYDVITFTFARVGLAYMTFPFIALELYPSWITLKAMYFWLHILCAVTYTFLTIYPLKKKDKEREL